MNPWLPTVREVIDIYKLNLMIINHTDKRKSIELPTIQATRAVSKQTIESNCLNE